VLPALVPAVAAGILLALSWRAWRTDKAEAGTAVSSAGGPLLGAFAFAAAHCLGYVLLKNGPPATPWADRVLSAEAWLFWIVLASGLVLTFEATRRPGSLAVWIARLPVATLTIALVLRAKLQHRWEGAEAVLWAGILFLLMVALWEAASRAGRHRGPAVPALLVIATSGLAVATGLSGSVFLAQLAGATAAGFGACTVVALRAGRVHLDRGAISVAIVALYGIGLSAVFYSDLPGSSAAAFAAVPFSLASAELPVLHERRGLQLVVRWGFTLALVALGTGIAVAGYEPDLYGY